MTEFNFKPALLTRNEIEWLLGNVKVSKAYQYKIKSVIRKKLEILTNVEIPLIQKTGIFSNDLTLFGKNLTTYGKVSDPINCLNFENFAQNMVGWKGFESSNHAISRRYLNQARPPAPYS